MSNEPEWRDANPATENLPNKGRTAIFYVAGGIIMFVLAIVGMKIRFLGLVFGGAAFFTGISFLLRRRKEFFKTGILICAAGFLMLLTYPGSGALKAIAGYLLIVCALLLFVFGLYKAVKLSWDVGHGI